MNKKLVWVIAAAVVALLVVFGGVVGLQIAGQKTAEAHLTATQVKAQGAALAGQTVRIAGRVVPGSIAWNSSTRVTTFQLADSQTSVGVTYKGALPNEFRPGDNLAVDARYVSEGEFEALSIPSNALCKVCHS